jgi:preprotein translocase subunit YajC
MTVAMKKISFDFKKCLSRSLAQLSLVFVVFATSAWADGVPVPAGAPVATGSPQQPGGLMAFAPFVLMFGVLYFLILRPQQKRMKEQQNMINALKQGDEIMTQSGILGKVTGITEKVVTVEIADNVRVKMLKSQVSQVLKGSIKDLA